MDQKTRIALINVIKQPKSRAITIEWPSMLASIPHLNGAVVNTKLCNSLMNVIVTVLLLVIATACHVQSFGNGNTRFLKQSKFYSTSTNTLLRMLSKQDEMKQRVGYKAVDDYVRSGMAIGLGTGSTAFHAIERIGQKYKSGELTNIECIPSSERTKQQALSLGLPLVTLNEKSKLDISIDGADDVDPLLNLVKGAGGSLLRDKMVYLPIVSKRFVCIVDESKLSKGLGLIAPLPVEITPFCSEHTRRLIETLPSLQGCKAVLRMGDVSNTKIDGPDVAVTDNGNYIVDLFFPSALADPQKAAQELTNTPGVLEHGLFIGVTSVLLVAGKDGVRVAGEGGERPWW